MPFQLLNPDGVAEYLHLTPTDIDQRIKSREIPFEKRGNRIVFHKKQIEDWASTRIMSLPDQKLAIYHGKSTRHTRKILANEAFLGKLLEKGMAASAMPSKTKSSVLDDLVALAEKTGHVNDPKALLGGLRLREELSSTAGPGGFAVPHARFHESWLYEASFLIVGRTVQQIHFGAPDGEPTRLFFLICCQDDRLHLHTLARLCVMARRANVMARLIEAPDAKAMQDILIATEQEVLSDPKNGPGN
jgi:PTS system nitrogen regulatory IIA component